MRCETIHSFIDTHRLIRARDRVLVGVSGGPDSMALLTVLTQIMPLQRVAVAHVNHGLRAAESDRDEQSVIAYAKKLGVPVFSCRVDVARYARARALSWEDAARQMRHDFFARVCREQGFTKLALAHTRDDQAETVMMRLLRGTGVRGLGAMQPKTKLGTLTIIRPLLGVSKGDVYVFLRKHGVPYGIDSSNAKTDFFRNKIRLEVLPFLKRYAPALSENLVRLSLQAQDIDAFLRAALSRKRARMVRSRTAQEIVLDRARVCALPVILKAELLRWCVEELCAGVCGFSMRHFVLFEQWCDDAGAHETSLDLAQDIVAARTRNAIHIRRGRDDRRQTRHARVWMLDLNREVMLDGFGVSLAAKAVAARVRRPGKHVSRQVEYFDADKLVFPLRVRGRRDGDVFFPLGSGGTKKLKKFLNECKLDAAAKERTAVVLSGKRIIWVVGLRISDAVKITPQTQRVVCMTVRPYRGSADRDVNRRGRRNNLPVAAHRGAGG